MQIESELTLTETEQDSSGKLEITSPESALGIAFYEAGTIKEIVVTGALEFLQGNQRNDFFDQCYKILSDGGKMTVTVPYWSSWRAYYDARIEWPPFCEQSFLCYNKAWREQNVKGLELECDFDFTYGYAWDQTTLNRNDEARAFWTQRYNNCVEALQLTLVKRPKQ